VIRAHKLADYCTNRRATYSCSSADEAATLSPSICVMQLCSPLMHSNKKLSDKVVQDPDGTFVVKTVHLTTGGVTDVDEHLAM
jgi:hypothetical protein